METQYIVEVAPFSLANGVTTDEILAASDRLEKEFLAKSEGYLGRFLAKLNDNVWWDIVLWQSKSHVDMAMSQIATSPACAAYFSCMKSSEEMPSIFELTKAYGRATAVISDSK